MFEHDTSVLVLPSPNVNKNGATLVGTYPLMCSHANVSGQKHFTLLPTITNSQIIDNDLKCRLNRYLFNNQTEVRPSIPTPSMSPIPRVTSALSIQEPNHNSTHDNGRHNTSIEYTTVVPVDSQVEQSPTMRPVVPEPFTEGISKKLNPKHIIRRDSLQHLQTDTKIEQRRRYICKVCSKAFTTSGHLARHNRIHTGEKNHVCPFEGCNQRFSRHDNCIQHYRTHLKKKSSV